MDCAVSSMPVSRSCGLFGYQAETQKGTGALDVFGGLVDFPSSSGVYLAKAKLRKYLGESLNAEFNEPESFDSALATYVSTDAPLSASPIMIPYT